ncbi:MAG: FAD binding domain-containing protein [Dehalococcoidia bacterium]|nr:FAD binding domain-containing protein [Dehalococcoidia bacterium]
MFRFEHKNAFSIAEASEILKGNAAVIAGGTDLLTTLKGMCIPDPPDVLVNIKTIGDFDMKRIWVDNGTLRVGACATLTEIANNADVNEGWAALAMAALKVGTPELRNAGTIGGNICQKPRCLYYRKDKNRFHCLRKNNAPQGALCYAKEGVNLYHSIFGADGGCLAVCPSDTAPALVALGAKIVTNKKPNGWDAEEFFEIKSDQINSLDRDEFVTEIKIPALPAGTKSVYKKFAFRRSFDFPLVGVAVAVTTSGSTVSDASIVLGGVHNMPLRAASAESFIKGETITDTTAADAGTEAVKIARDTLSAYENPKVGYKIQIAKTLVKRALLETK